MKKVLVLLLAASTFVGCDLFGEDILDFSFNYDLKSIMFKIKPQANAGTYELDRFTVTSELQVQAEAEGTNLDKIKEVGIKKVRVRILSPEGATFGAIDRAEMFLQSPTMADALSFASVENNGAEVTEIELVPADVDMKELLKDDFDVWATITTNKEVSDTIELEAIFNFEITASPIN